jgi:D-arabinose 1-dehydrogenase-like Zn-dependent alcohol dehydrogenase
VAGGYATAVTASASSVFAKPSTLSFPEAANLLLVGTTAADLLHASRAADGETVLLHGAAGAAGVSVLQQARLLGVRVELAQDGDLIVPMAQTFKFAAAPAAVAALTGPHPPGKLALVNEP